AATSHLRGWILARRHPRYPAPDRPATPRGSTARVSAVVRWRRTPSTLQDARERPAPGRRAGGAVPPPRGDGNEAAQFPREYLAPRRARTSTQASRRTDPSRARWGAMVR